MRKQMAIGMALGTGMAVILGVLLFAGLRYLALLPPDPQNIDPQLWETRYPHYYAASMRTQTDYGRTAFGGSTRYDKLEANPFRRRAFAGHPFAREYNAARGHFYAQIDQQKSARTQEFSQPAACIHCHAAEAPGLITEHGWEAFHRLTYDELKNDLHHGTSCTDCHDRNTMELRVTRQAFIRGMSLRGVDVTTADRNQLRTFVCAQCHVEYYFRGPDRELVLPWSHGLRLEDIERHYDDYGFQDWVHSLSGAPMIKMQHPEFELYSTGTHASRGVSCVDCHMPAIHEGGLKLTDHWIRSPLTNVQHACMHCHRGTPDDLRKRSEEIQQRTTEQLRLVEAAIDDLIDAIVAARDAGADEETLRDALHYHRRAQLRWDFIDAENSTGFHSSQESARILMHALDLARKGERSLILPH